MLNHSRSQHDFHTAKQFIPGGVNSPVRAFKAVGGEPIFIDSAKGAYLFDVDGNQYIDYVGSWGPMIEGHAHPAVIEAVIETAKKGLSFGAPCEQEMILARLICERVSSIEKIRFVSSGTEATMTALRLARGATGRDKIMKFEGCYHGHSDCLLVKAGSGALTFGAPNSPGVPAGAANDTLIAQFNDLTSIQALFETHGKDIAAIIVEPIAGNMNMVLPLPGFLEGLRELCNHYGALLIFDEVMTGFRVGYQGIQSIVNVVPDITTLGKIIGGGMPVGAIGGRADIMDHLSPIGSVYQAGTLSGNPIAMAAGIATLSSLTENKYAILAEKTACLIEGLTARANAMNIPFFAVHTTGMFGFYFTELKSVNTFSDVMKSNVPRFNQFFHAMLEAGIYLAPSVYEAGFMSLAHSELDIQKTLLAAEKAFQQLSA